MVGSEGLEPSTVRVKAGCCYQLSYDPKEGFALGFFLVVDIGVPFALRISVQNTVRALKTKKPPGLRWAVHR